MNTVFLAWQDSVACGWHPIGRLTRIEGGFEFAYVQGVAKARDERKFHAMQSFPDIETIYRSEELFPLFANRLLRPSRPDYPKFIEWLGLPQGTTDPVEILARSGGRRVTDNLAVFPCPEPDENGEYRVHFFAHGLRHLSATAMDRVEQLNDGEQLFLLRDLRNPVDPNALALKTVAVDDDSHTVGYCPRYFAQDFARISAEPGTFVSVRVVKVNHPPAPIQMRLLCELRAVWPEGFKPLSGDEWKPVVATGRESEEAA